MNNKELKTLIEYHFDNVKRLCKESAYTIDCLVADTYLDCIVNLFKGNSARFDALDNLIKQLIKERDRLVELREIGIKNNKKRKD
jgi:hypothetical protein